jgi:hypothetical protein
MAMLKVCLVRLGDLHQQETQQRVALFADVPVLRNYCAEFEV